MSQPPTRLNRRFGFVVGGALLAGAGVYYLRHHSWPPVPLAAGAWLVVAAALVPRWLTAPRQGWEAVGHGLGRMNSFVLLTLVYALVCVPLGWLLRRLGHDPLRRAWQPQAPTYWQPKPAANGLGFQF